MLLRPVAQDTEIFTLPLIYFPLNKISKALHLRANVTRKSSFQRTEKEYSIGTGVVWMRGYYFPYPEAMQKGIF